MHDIQVSTYLRNWNYKETSNKAAEYRTYSVPGMSAQYNLHLGKEKVKNNISAGVDFKWQNISMYKLQSGSDPDRMESIDETNIETDSLLANQLISQKSIGAFLLYKLEIGKFSLMANVRYDDMNNELTDKMMAGDTAVTSEDFSHTSGRVGINYAFMNEIIRIRQLEPRVLCLPRLRNWQAILWATAVSIQTLCLQLPIVTNWVCADLSTVRSIMMLPGS